MKRSKHTLSHYRMATGNMGELMPIACVPVLPGDTVQHHTSALVRVSPLNTPVMHPVQVRIHHFFVPNRIIWRGADENDGWEAFITGGPDGTAQPEIPTITSSTNKKTISAYLGVPPIAGTEFNSLPVRAVNEIYNEFYRDQDLVSPRGQNDNSPLQNIAWEKDYFSVARPFSQKGPDVTLPLGDRADVLGIGMEDSAIAVNGPPTGGTWLQADGTPIEGPFWNTAVISANKLMAAKGTGNAQSPDIYADLSTASAPSVNDFRNAFAIQRYQEARARYGSRFTEYLRYLGISPSDARLQRPEFLGGGTTRLNFSEVLQTTPNVLDGTPGQQGVGDLFGHGIAGARTNRYRKFFEEHGYIITMMSVRPKAIYTNGVPREFLKRTKEDYYQKELANLGQQEVYQAELYSENDRDVFGYTDRYAEYRSQPSQVSQDFRDTLNAWHLARDLAPDVTLNEDFVTCNPSDRIFQVGEDVADTLWIMANHHMVARRIVPKRANPKIM